MENWTLFIILIVVSYILGSIPASFLAARTRGIDLRKHGTRQVGGGNLFRTTSRRLGLAVSIFDFFKGILMVLIASRVGLDPGQQLAVGLAVVVGHNWPVFLRFHGGRGILTGGGIIIILPIIEEVVPWSAVAFLIIVIGGAILFRSTPVPILVGVVLLPVISAIFLEPLAVTLGYLAMTLIIIIKRLTAQKPPEDIQGGMGRLLLNRLLYDRDISDRKAWMGTKQTSERPT